MQQSGFLSKLYDIKPFKIVQSPQTIKHQQNPISTHSDLNTKQYNSIPTLQQYKFSNSQTTSLQATHILYPLKAQNCNIALNSTPTKMQVHPFINQLSSSKKIVRKYSNNQTASPNRVILHKKLQAMGTNYHNALHSPVKTPNKQNSLPIGTMIQSHLYTSLSSSIDTLFSKIQKIKQQFEYAPSATKNDKQKGTFKISKNQKPSNYKNAHIQNKSDINGYSPIAKPIENKDNQSQLSSLSPFLHNNKNNKNINNKDNMNMNMNDNSKSYNRNKMLVNKIYSKQQYKDNNYVQPFIIPITHNTHTNITQINNKTQSIIDQINGLMDNSTYNNKQQLRSGNINKYKRNNTINYDTVIYNQYKDKISGMINTIQDNKQFDQFDQQFITIKLKSTQSQYVPKIQQQSSNNNNDGMINNRSNNKNKYQKQYQNVSYKIDFPLYKQPNQTHNNANNNNNSNNNNFVQQFKPTHHSLSMRQFQLGKCIGSGKFGDVHICKHKQTGLIYGIKKIFKSTIIQYNMIQQFILQLKIHYCLSNNHNNITKLYTHFQDQYHIFLVMEYIEDGNLMGYLQKDEQFVSKVVYQVLNAVEYLHRNNIAHRDIKPQNILLTNGIVKICDFGWSSRFKDQMRRTFCGTLDYVSPQMKDRGQYNTSVDLWSIGVLTFQLLVGFPPYKKQIDKWKIMGGNMKNKWRWDVIFPPQVSQCARSFIENLLKENPEERISIRECRQHQFITKYNNNNNNRQSQGYNKIFQKVLN